MKKDLSTTECITCQEMIKELAKKCTHCDSYQDWRRYLNLGNTALSLIVALISVLAIAAPSILKYIQDDSEWVTVRVIGDSGGNIVLLFANSGGSPGVVSVQPEILLKGKKYPVYLNENFGDDRAKANRLIISKNSPQVLIGRTNGGTPIANEKGPDICVLESFVYDQNGKNRILKNNFSCATSK